jgi:hypothetical protein
VDAFIAFLFGFLGGAIVQYRDVMNVSKLPPGARGAWLTAPFYWCAIAGYAVIGGAVALSFSLSGFDVRPLLAINIGAAWPLVLERGSHLVPEVDTRIS